MLERFRFKSSLSLSFPIEICLHFPEANLWSCAKHFYNLDYFFRSQKAQSNIVSPTHRA